jgi:hypothetical protein
MQQNLKQTKQQVGEGLLANDEEAKGTLRNA